VRDSFDVQQKMVSVIKVFQPSVIGYGYRITITWGKNLPEALIYYA
jgi:hypothetical protein